MTTLCLECGTRISSRLDFIEGIKTVRHLSKNHPNLKEVFSNNQERATDAVTLEDGSVVHLVGDIVSYEGEDGEKIIQVEQID